MIGVPWEVGDWVTLESSNGWRMRGQVSKRRESHGEVTYTVKQFPDTASWIDIAEVAQ